MKFTEYGENLFEENRRKRFYLSEVTGEKIKLEPAYDQAIISYIKNETDIECLATPDINVSIRRLYMGGYLAKFKELDNYAYIPLEEEKIYFLKRCEEEKDLTRYVLMYLFMYDVTMWHLSLEKEKYRESYEAIYKRFKANGGVKKQDISTLEMNRFKSLLKEEYEDMTKKEKYRESYEAIYKRFKANGGVKKQDISTLEMNRFKSLLKEEYEDMTTSVFEYTVETNTINVDFESERTDFEWSDPDDIENREFIERIAQNYIIPKHATLALKGGYKAVLLEGSPGTMKTGAAFALAYHLNGLIFKMDCTPDMDEVNLIGQFLPNVEYGKSGGERFVFSPSPLTRAFRKAKALFDEFGSEAPAVILVVDEINYINNPAVLGILNGLLDTGTYQLSTSEKLVWTPNLKVFFTMNDGLQGTNEINDAFKDRVRCMKVPDLTEGEVLEIVKNNVGISDEENFKKIINIIFKINDRAYTDYDFNKKGNLRPALKIAEDLKMDIDLEDSILMNVIYNITFDQDIIDDLMLIYEMM